MSSAIRSKIVGTGSYTAAGVLTNFDLEKLVDTSNDWIVERTGIHERRVAAEDVNTSDMATQSLKQALDMAGGNRARAARLLDMPYKAFLYRLDKHGLTAAGD